MGTHEDEEMGREIAAAVSLVWGTTLSENPCGDEKPAG